MIKKSLGLILASSCLATSAYAVDVVGIKLGSSASDLKRAMTAADAEMAFADVKLQDGQLIGLQGRKMVGSGWSTYAADQMVGLFDAQGRIWYVGRAQKYEKGSRPTLDATVAALRNKYGQPSFGSRNLFEWQYDTNGALFQGQQMQSPCWTGTGAATMPFSVGPQSPGLTAPRIFNGHCGIRIVASAMSANDGMVDSLVVTMFDSASQYAQIERDKASATAEQQSKLNAEKSKGVRPGI
jgi:hypothetical protein